jgi:hypothetical protein
MTSFFFFFFSCSISFPSQSADLTGKTSLSYLNLFYPPRRVGDKLAAVVQNGKEGEKTLQQILPEGQSFLPVGFGVFMAPVNKKILFLFHWFAQNLRLV